MELTSAVPHHLRAAFDRELARARSVTVGFASLDIPPRPVYTNDEACEAERRVEHQEFVARCTAEAAAWNTEAQRWHAERLSVIEDRIYAEAQEIIARHGLPADSDVSSAPADRSSDMILGEMGIIGTTMLDSQAERQSHVSTVVAEALALAQWKRSTEERRRAILSVCTERRRAFVARWRRLERESRRKEDAAHMLQVGPGQLPTFDGSADGGEDESVFERRLY